MHTLLQQFVNKNKLFHSSNKLVLAVSGGIDSVCMAHLIKKLGLDAAIAHCNFGLRGEESDNEELFVKQLAQDLSYPFHSIQFKTNEYAEIEGLSIQVAARNLRYNWFENLRKKLAFDFIAIAHNADDSIETFFINLMRGSGIHGLTGIRPKNELIVRPLLFASRQQIEMYCKQNNISFRNDSSNESDKYLRNKIRHTIIPSINEINPSFHATMGENLSRLSETEQLYNYAINNFIKQIIEVQLDGNIHISITDLDALPTPQTILFELLKKYNFSPSTCYEIYENRNGMSGQVYYSKTKRIIKDRELFIITDIEITKDSKTYIEANTAEIDFPVRLKFNTINGQGYEIINNNNIAAFDIDKLNYPLIIRKWHNGDYFKPLGLNGMKKLSDFFIDKKHSIAEKENTWLLVSANEIVWIIGQRIDDRFKITTDTQKVLEIEFIS